MHIIKENTSNIKRVTNNVHIAEACQVKSINIGIKNLFNYQAPSLTKKN